MTARAVTVCAVLALLACAPSADAALEAYGQSTVWQPAWATLAYPPVSDPSGTTPYFIVHMTQLPTTISAGDLILVEGAEEFSNPADYRTSGDSIKFADGRPSEHWTTPVMGDCGLVRSASPAGPWAQIVHDQAENFTGTQHHWKWHTATFFAATSTSLASAYIATRCRFGRSTGYRDPANDYIVGETTYGRIKFAVVN